MAIPEMHQTWFKEVCKHCALDEIDTAVNDGGFCINDTPFLFIQGATAPDTHLLVQAIVGTLPKTGGMDILRRLFEMQLVMAGPDAPVFGLEPTTNAIALIHSMAPGEVDPEGAAMLLEATVKTIERLRETVFNSNPVPAKSLQKQMVAAMKTSKQDDQSASLTTTNTKE